MTSPEQTMPIIGHYIDGQNIAGNGECKGDVFNPATGEIQAQVRFATESEVQQAIAAAAEAFPAWSATSPLKRARVMFKFKELLEKNSDEIGRASCRERV